MSLHRKTIGRPAIDPERSTVAPAALTSPLILAHGFTQNSNCWGRFADRLNASADLILVDAPGHGLSGHDDADLRTAAELLTDCGGAGIYIGYSMGGRIALHAALAKPDLVNGLVLIGATAGLDGEEDRAARRDADNQLADRLLEVGLERFIDRWLANPLFAGLDDTAAARDQRLTNRPEGLAASLRSCGTGTQQPLWDRLGELTMPVLIVAGARDEKFSAIGRRMAEAMTGTAAELAIIEGTHAVHLEQPEQTADTIVETITTRW